MKPKSVLATVSQITALTEGIFQLLVVPETFVNYHAGQYLKIQFDHDESCYSIANAPIERHHYELHIRINCQSNEGKKLYQALTKGHHIHLSLPFGHCHLNQLHQKKPIVFIAGGTGITPIKAMIEQQIAHKIECDMTLFWGARSPEDLYLEPLIKQWQHQATQLKYYAHTPQTSQQSLMDSVLEHTQQPILRQSHIVISGPFDLAYHIRDKLVAYGIPLENLFSDAFDFER